MVESIGPVQYIGYTSYPDTIKITEMGNTDFACQARARAILWATINIFAQLILTIQVHLDLDKKSKSSKGNDEST